MKVKAVYSFVSPEGRHNKGEIFDLPPNTNWLDIGRVVPVKDSGIEAAVIEPKETAVVSKPRTQRKKG